MRIHFIAIGGAVMHNLAIAMKNKGYEVTGSDDEIFEPSKSRLAKYNLLPSKTGWYPEKINKKINSIILGMHAQEDNPELIKALKLGIKIYSFPEFMFEQTKNKIRVVIGGSHGKTTITSIIMHVLKLNNNKFDYLVGALIEGFETMVNLEKDSQFAVFEGDEYLTSALDPRPKFHIYKPNIAVISGIAWDHINVFPTFEKYIKQFKIFVNRIEPGGTLIYNKNDEIIKKIISNSRIDIKLIGYSSHPYKIINGKLFLIYNNEKIQVQLFGSHNLENIEAAKLVLKELGISEVKFYNAIQSFKGAAKRLQLIKKNESTNIYLDFAHSPSKLNATIKAVKEQFPQRRLIACFELHTFSSLNKKYLNHYSNSMDLPDVSIVYFDPKTLEHKNLPEISNKEVKKAFCNNNLIIFTFIETLKDYLIKQNWKNTNLLLMSSGNFSGLEIEKLANYIISN